MKSNSIDLAMYSREDHFSKRKKRGEPNTIIDLCLQTAAIVKPILVLTGVFYCCLIIYLDMDNYITVIYDRLDF